MSRPGPEAAEAAETAEAAEASEVTIRDLSGTAGRWDLDPTVGWGRPRETIPGGTEETGGTEPSVTPAPSDAATEEASATPEFETPVTAPAPPDDIGPADGAVRESGEEDEAQLAPLAPLGARVLAGLVDYGAPALLTGLALLWHTGVAGLVALVAVGYLAYNSVEQGLTGYSPGKRLLHLRLVGATTGEPIGPARAVLRLVGHLADAVALGGIIPMLTDRSIRTLGDRIVGSHVIVEPPSGGTEHGEPRPPDTDG